MIQARWTNALVAALALAGFAAAQVDRTERIMVVRECGKKEQNCKILKSWHTPDGSQAYEVWCTGTGERMTIVEKGPRISRVGSGDRIQEMVTRIYHWGMKNVPPPGAPIAPEERMEAVVLAGGMAPPVQKPMTANEAMTRAPDMTSRDTSPAVSRFAAAWENSGGRQAPQVNMAKASEMVPPVPAPVAAAEKPVDPLQNPQGFCRTPLDKTLPAETKRIPEVMPVTHKPQMPEEIKSVTVDENDGSRHFHLRGKLRRIFHKDSESWTVNSPPAVQTEVKVQESAAVKVQEQAVLPPPAPKPEAPIGHAKASYVPPPALEPVASNSSTPALLLDAPRTSRSLAMNRKRMDLGGLPGNELAPSVETIHQLTTMLKDEVSPSRREWAADRLADMNWRTHPIIVEALVQAAREDPAPTVRAECVRCLAKMHADTANVLSTLEALKAEKEEFVRAEAVKALAALGK